MRYVYGSLVNSVPVMNNPGQIATDLAGVFGGSWSNLVLKNGYAASADDGQNHATAWANGPYVLVAKNLSTGVVKVLDVEYDAMVNECYRPVNLAGLTIGAGAASTCSGCDDCIEIFNSNLQTTGCDCIGDGSCGLSTVILT